MATVSALFYHFLEELDDTTAEDTLLLVVADHGHVNTDPDGNINLATYDELLRNIRRHADGTPVRLAGSPRNVHLHLQDGTRGATRAALADLEARLYCRQAVLSMNFFGDRSSSDRFRRRYGDLLPTHRNLGTWFADIEPADLSLVGMHGGLYPAEILDPFAAVRADRLEL